MKNLRVTVNGKAYDVQVEELGGSSAPVAATPVSTPVPAPAVAPAPAPSAAPAGGEKVTAPMPGTVLDIKANVGDTVKKGDTLLVLEAMKMENEIPAVCDGKVSAVLVSKGDNVDTGAALVVIG